MQSSPGSATGLWRMSPSITCGSHTHSQISFARDHRPLTDATLAGMLLHFPLMRLKVVAAIHFEAVRQMLKEIPRHPHAPKALYAPAD
jgi:DUF1365 family protein